MNILEELLSVRSDRRDPELVPAMARETRRLLAHYRRQVRLSDDEEELRQQYVIELVRGLGESGKSEFIPLIAEFAGFSRLAIDALLRFGDQAIPIMAEVANRPSDELNARGGISAVFAELLRPRPGSAAPALSERSRATITAFAEQILRRDSPLPSNEVLNLVRVALASGRPDLRAEVERLATDPSALASHGVTRAESIAMMQNILRGQLKIYSQADSSAGRNGILPQ